MIKQGDLVTLEIGTLYASNVYVVGGLFGEDVLLTHPWAHGCYLLRKASEVNIVAASDRTPRERCVSFILANRNLLSDNDQTEIESLATYYFIKRRFSSRQLEALYSLCGKIAAIQTQHSTGIAIQIVNENKALLDDFTQQRYQAFRKLFETQEVPQTREQRANVFNVAGFVIAQIKRTDAHGVE